MWRVQPPLGRGPAVDHRIRDRQQRRGKRQANLEALDRGSLPRLRQATGRRRGLGSGQVEYTEDQEAGHAALQNERAPLRKGSGVAGVGWPRLDP